MTLRSRTLLMVTGLLVVAVLATSAVLTWTNRQAMLAEAEREGELLAKQLGLSAAYADEVTAEVEDAIGEQMIVEASITAHLVALAEGAKIAPETINAHLRAIARDTALTEIWVTDEKGHAYLRNVAEIDFTFSPDPQQQPQAHLFWSLLTGEKRSLVQEARKREVDAQVFKYVGVAGVDKPRIVQVGYRAQFLEVLRRKVGLTHLVEELVAGHNVIAMRVVDKDTTTIVYSAIPGQRLPPDLSEADKAELRAVIGEQKPRSDFDGDMLKIIAPITGDGGSRRLAATVVYLPADRVRDSVQRNIERAALVAAGVLVAGLLASLILAR